MNSTRLAALALASAAAFPAHSQEDPYLWLEEVQGEKAIAWVKEQNAVSQRLIEALPQFAPVREKILAALSSRERIPTVQKRGAWLYNYWQDATHVRGVRRRTTMEEYKKREPKWETTLDLDQLAKDEKENWVWR